MRLEPRARVPLALALAAPLGAAALALALSTLPLAWAGAPVLASDIDAFRRVLDDGRPHLPVAREAHGVFGGVDRVADDSDGPLATSAHGPHDLPDVRLARDAILLDVDGTLLDIAPTPDQVFVPDSLRAALVAIAMPETRPSPEKTGNPND